MGFEDDASQQQQQADVETKAPTSPRGSSMRKVNSFRFNLVSALTGKLSTSSRRLLRKEKSNAVDSVRFQEQAVPDHESSSRTLSAAESALVSQSSGSKNCEEEEEKAVDEQDLLAAEATAALLNAARAAPATTSSTSKDSSVQINPADLAVTENLQTPLIARFSFHGKSDANELDVRAGARLTGVSKNNLWWVAIDDATQAVGYIPSNYVDEV